MAVLVGFIGLIFGSFLNACIYRLPRGESLLWPCSHCPVCQHPLGVWELIPVISFLGLRGRCRFCQSPISPRYLVVELLAGLLCVALYLQFGFTWSFFAYTVFALLLLLIAVIDLEHMVIFDLVSIPGIIIGLLFSFRPDFNIWSSLLGIAVGFIPLGLVHWLYPEGLGGGDVKLMAMVGAFLGWQGVLSTLFLGSFAGAVVTLSLIALGRRTRKEPIPFGPFLAVGALVWLFWGDVLDKLVLIGGV